MMFNAVLLKCATCEGDDTNVTSAHLLGRLKVEHQAL
jgi:hypothetical protein